MLTFHLFPSTHAPLIHVLLLCLTIPGNKRHGALVLLNIYAFMDLYRASRAARSAGGKGGGAEWHRQSVSVENLHWNKSYNLSPVCTLDWLRAITLTKKTFFPLLLLSPSCFLPSSWPCVKLTLRTFLKISVYFLFFLLRAQAASELFFFLPSPLSFSNMAPGRGDCLPNETAVKNSQCLSVLSPSLFYLTLSHLPTPLAERKREGASQKALSPPSSRWDLHRC